MARQPSDLTKSVYASIGGLQSFFIWINITKIVYRPLKKDPKNHRLHPQGRNHSLSLIEEKEKKKIDDRKKKKVDDRKKKKVDDRKKKKVGDRKKKKVGKNKKTCKSWPVDKWMRFPGYPPPPPIQLVQA